MGIWTSLRSTKDDSIFHFPFVICQFAPVAVKATKMTNEK